MYSTVKPYQMTVAFHSDTTKKASGNTVETKAAGNRMVLFSETSLTAKKREIYKPEYFMNMHEMKTLD